MLETIRRYWIGLLVLVLVTLHASIVGLIRYQASMAKTDVTCEVDLGKFLAYRPKEELPVEMHLYAIVPLNHRMKSRQLIELNHAQVRQAIEEHLRQLDGRLLIDPYLSDLRSQLHEIMSQTLGASSIEDVVITNLEQLNTKTNLSFLANANRPEPRKLVATLRSSSSEEEAEHPSEEGEHEEGEEEESEASGGHGEPAAPSKPAASHGAPPKKPAAESSHGSKPAKPKH